MFPTLIASFLNYDKFPAQSITTTFFVAKRFIFLARVPFFFSLKCDCICVLYFSSLLSSLLSWDPVQPDLLWAEFPKDHLYILLTAKPCFIHTWYYDMVGVMHPMEPGAEDLEVARRGGSWGYQATAQEI